MGETPLTDLQSAIIHQLQYGNAHAITGEILAKRFNYKDDRQVRKGIEELIRVHHYAIVSSIKPPYGYFLVETQKEADEYVEDLDKRAAANAIRKHEFKLAVKLGLKKPKQFALF